MIAQANPFLRLIDVTATRLMKRRSSGRFTRQAEVVLNRILDMTADEHRHALSLLMFCELAGLCKTEAIALKDYLGETHREFNGRQLPVKTAVTLALARLQKVSDAITSD